MKYKRPATPTGVTVIEVIVAVAVVALVGFAIVNVLLTAVKTSLSSQAKQTAVSLASQQLEIIKNLPYDDVGTTGGIPAGSIANTSSQTINGITFTTDTSISYVDDSYDSKAPTDTLNTDYKKADVTVTWNGAYGDAISLSTVIVPNGLETATTGGTLVIQVYDPSTDPISPLNKASVTITAPTVTPAVSTTLKTDVDGQVILPGAPAGIAAYHISVTKSGYDTDENYAVDASTNPNPNPGYLNIVDGQITTQSFQISHLGTSLSIHTTDIASNVGVPVAFTLNGNTSIGTDVNGDAIYKYSNTTTTDSTGNFSVVKPEADSYTPIIDASSGYSVAGYTSDIPVVVLPGGSSAITLYVTPFQAYNALLTITNPSGTRLSDATVTLTSSTGEITTLTTTSYGQAFFNNLSADNYTVTVDLTGYASYAGTLTVTGNENETISLS